jgi:DNA-binding NarL/FixJ family response regulator
VIRLIVADDAPLVRSGDVAIVGTAADITVVGEAGDGREALALAERIRPDVLLADLKMPELDGVELTRRLRTALPSCRVLVLTTFDRDGLVFDALRAGAAGYLTKDVSGERLLDAIRAVARGDSMLAPAIASKVLAEFVRMTPTTPGARPVFSARELEVLVQLARGASNKEIARGLGVAEGTIKNHVTSILAKLGVSDRTAAALRARELGIT